MLCVERVGSFCFFTGKIFSPKKKKLKIKKLKDFEGFFMVRKWGKFTKTVYSQIWLNLPSDNCHFFTISLYGWLSLKLHNEKNSFFLKKNSLVCWGNNNKTHPLLTSLMSIYKTSGYRYLLALPFYGKSNKTILLWQFQSLNQPDWTPGQKPY